MSRWSELEAALAEEIGGARLAHSYRVVETAQELCRRFDVPVRQAEVAALMHDYARDVPAPVLLAEARQRGLVTDPAEIAQPLLLHGLVAAAWLQERNLVTDPEVLDAIRFHTTGREQMTRLEQVVWLADYIEPGRSFSEVEPIRQEAQQDLGRAVRKAMDATIVYLVGRGWLLHLQTVRARNWFVQSEG